jgi:hypothetical protein
MFWNGNGCAGKRDQVRYRSAVQRQFQNSLVLDHRAHGRTARFDLRQIRLYLDLFCDLADLEYHVDDGIAVHLQVYTGLHECAESRQRCLEPIRTQREVCLDLVWVTN